MAKYSINLLQADLLPPKIFWTLKRVVSLWLVILVLMLCLIFIVQLQLSNVKAEFKTLSSMSTKQKQQIKSLELDVKNHQKNNQLLLVLNNLKLIIDNKQDLHQQLTDPTQTYSTGFSTVMSELADLHDPNISLQRVNIASDKITLSGLAREPDAVPNWLSGFESSTFLAGKNFINFTLSQNEQQLTEFTVSSSVTGGQ